MQACDFENMQVIAKKRFVKMHKRKRLAHHNHELHFMAREIDEVLNNGIGHLITGGYSPRPLRRYYFPEETFDAVYPSDHILQHILLKQLKPTFKHFINKNCYHLFGPTGVEHVKKRIDPDQGIALRGPLSQFFSAMYLKPLDDTFDNRDVTYLRCQDDYIIFCKIKRQLQRAKQGMMAVLHDRQLKLSSKSLDQLQFGWGQI